MQNETEKTLANNRKAYHDYFIDEVYEAGVVLTGTEIKSARAGRVNLRDSYAKVTDGEMWMYNTHISPYDQGSRFNHDPDRPRKLLLHNKEIRQLARAVLEKGFTLVPVRMYLKNHRAKVALALAKGRKSYDKRDAVAERDAQRDIDRELMRHD
ncbi:MAG: SsrA-binding protein SmpB [Chloroflexota bacterium]